MNAALLKFMRRGPAISFSPARVPHLFRGKSPHDASPHAPGRYGGPLRCASRQWAPSIRGRALPFPGAGVWAHCRRSIDDGHGEMMALRGLGAIKAAGGMTIAQSEDTCVVSGMPRAAILKGYANKIIPLDGLGAYLVSNYGAERGATDKAEKNEKLEKERQERQI